MEVNSYLMIQGLHLWQEVSLRQDLYQGGEASLISLPGRVPGGGRYLRLFRPLASALKFL